MSERAWTYCEVGDHPIVDPDGLRWIHVRRAGGRVSGPVRSCVKHERVADPGCYVNGCSRELAHPDVDYCAYHAPSRHDDRI